MSADPSYDLAVIGAGPAGAATAFHAAQAGLKVVLLDSARFPRDKICGDGLTARALPKLQAMGVAQTVLHEGARIARFELAAPGLRLQSPLVAAPGYPDHAAVLPRLRLDALLVAAATAAGAELREQHRVEGWTLEGEAQRVRSATPAGVQALQARLVVLACGAHLGLPQRMGLLGRKPEAMVGVRQYVERYGSDNDLWRLHYSRATVPGYGWVFPAGAGRANVGVGLYRRSAGPRLNALLERYRRGAAATALAGSRLIGAPQSFPLRSDFLRARVSGPRLLLAGEAAGLVNPLTGEGIDYALESGRLAAAEAARRLASADPAGDDGRWGADLHARYGALFMFSERLRDWCGSPLRVSLLAAAAQLRPDLKLRLVRLLLGGGAIGAMPTTARLLRALLRPPGDARA